MASRVIFRLTMSLLILLSSLYFAQASSDADFIKTEAERLARSFNLSPKKSANIEHNATVKPMGLVDRRFIFPGLSPTNTSAENLGHHSGYFPIKHSYDARMFYYFFESRVNKSDPVVLWLTGGPGCGSEVALFYENGPFYINNDLSLRWNDYGWDKVSNILFVDQPTGTGFSYTSDERDIRTNETEVSNDLYDFLQAFFQSHSKFVKNDFYITGESYAGHYIPALASRLQKGNKAKEGIHINLKGFAIGNGLTDPEYQYPSYTDFALDNKLIPKSTYDELNKLNPECVKSIQQCQTDDNACEDAYITCNNIFRVILRTPNNINYYDIRKQCEGPLCYDFSNLEKFLALDSVKKALGVGNIEYVSCSNMVYEAMINDWMKDCEVYIPPLLEDGIKALIYVGEYDLICNWLGNYNWVNAMKWSDQLQFSKANLTTYEIEGKEAGLIKSSGPLTFIKVHNAGHMVPMDQPNISLQMLQNWMKA